MKLKRSFARPLSARLSPRNLPTGNGSSSRPRTSSPLPSRSRPKFVSCEGVLTIAACSCLSFLVIGSSCVSALFVVIGFLLGLSPLALAISCSLSFWELTANFFFFGIWALWAGDFTLKKWELAAKNLLFMTQTCLAVRFLCSHVFLNL